MGTGKWLELPEDHDYLAAAEYLRLTVEPERASATVALLRQAPISLFKAKDILRASGLAELGSTNRHVAHDLKKMKNGQALSPVLLVRSSPLIIADGFHRVCAVYLDDEDAQIPCQIVGFAEP